MPHQLLSPRLVIELARKEKNVDNPKYRLKITCLIHSHGHSLDKCKFLGDFVTNYAKNRPTKYCRKDPETNKKFGRHLENNDTTQHAVDEIILQENEN